LFLSVILKQKSFILYVERGSVHLSNRLFGSRCFGEQNTSSIIAHLSHNPSLIKGIAQKIVRSNKPNVRLYECVECSSSILQESEVCEQGAYPVYGANGIVGYLDNYNTEGEAVYIIKDGSGVGTVSYVTGKCSTTGTLNTLQAKDGYSLQYLYYLLKVFNFEPYKTGMAIPHIYFKDYGKAKFFCPSYTEQLQYAQSLSAIDSKLLVEKNILTNLTLQKQYLLRQMFI
jgi:type I restriction enzyme, S subunit